ncbi:MAG: PspC domain-containing protein [Candidatus Marinimicrobia bacterium]|nr:PspC domain-containing protein [Candidatus Neomarinimicrobiota bacterium]
MYRDLDNKKITGVCAELANYFDIDPMLIRILFPSSICAGGAGLVLYLLSWWYLIPIEMEK